MPAVDVLSDLARNSEAEPTTEVSLTLVEFLESTGGVPPPANAHASAGERRIKAYSNFSSDDNPF